MNAPDRFFLPDPQGLPDRRAMSIRTAGVKGRGYPHVLAAPDGAALG